MLKHAKTSAIADGGDTNLVQPSDWNAGHVIDSDGADAATRTDAPAPPAAGNARLYGRDVASRSMLSVIGPDGGPHTLQPHFGRNKVVTWIPQGNSASVTVLGAGALTLAGSAAGRNVAAASLFESARRVGAVSASTAAATCGYRWPTAQWMRGNVAGAGGFHAIFRFGCSDAATVADARCLVGLVEQTAILGNANPSSRLNLIAIGTDSGDANLSIIHNDSSGTATKVALGANFPDHTLSTDLYELALYCPPNAAYVGYQVTRLNTGHVTSGTITTDLPSATTLLCPHIWRNNGTTALACAIDFSSIYIETET